MSHKIYKRIKSREDSKEVLCITRNMLLIKHTCRHSVATDRPISVGVERALNIRENATSGMMQGTQWNNLT